MRAISNSPLTHASVPCPSTLTVRAAPCVLEWWVNQSVRSLFKTPKKKESHSVMSNFLPSHGPYSSWNSPGQNTGVGSLSLLQGNLPDPGIKPGSPALQVDSLPAESAGKSQNSKEGSLSYTVERKA